MKTRRLLSAGIAAVIAVSSIEAFSIISAAEEVPIDAVTFTDTAFRQFVTDNLDLDGNGKLNDYECERVTNLNVSGSASSIGSIASLEGIEKFVNLKTLDCSYNKISDLDVSSLRELRTLNCSHNLLTRLSYSSLHTLDCSYNQLESLDVSGGMETLKCNNNKIRNLDVRKKGYLVTLDCSNNRLGCLDTEGSPRLNQIKLDNNCYELGANIIELREDSPLFPVGFKMYKATDWINAEKYVTGNEGSYKRSIRNITNKIITYTYEMSSGNKAKFSMYVNNPDLPGEPPWSLGGNSGITDPYIPDIGGSEGVVWVNGKDYNTKDPKNDVLFKTWKFHHYGLYFGGTWNVVTTDAEIDTVGEFLTLFDGYGKLNESGKRVVKAAKKIASAKIRQGDVTVTAGKESGVVRVWVYEVCNRRIVNNEGLGIVPSMRTVTVFTASGKPCIAAEATDFDNGVLIKGRKAVSKVEIIYKSGEEEQEGKILYYGDKVTEFSSATSFSVESSEERVVFAELGGDNSILLMPLSVGSSKITLKNIQSGKSVTIKVTVKSG